MMEMCPSKNTDLKLLEKGTFVMMFVVKWDKGVITVLYMKLHVLSNIHRFKSALHVNGTM